MSYLNEILKRASARSVTDYLLYGNRANEKTVSCEERLKQAYNDCLKIVQKYDSKGENSELFKAINNLTTEHEEVYMEIGIQAGFRMAKNMLGCGCLPDKSEHK